MNALGPPFIAFALLISGSFAVAAEQSDSVYLENFSCADGPFRLRLPRSYAAVRTIGQLRDEKIVDVQSWDKYKTEDRILTFDGLRLDLVTFTDNKNRYLISQVHITSSSWTFAGGFRVGGSANAAAARLGVKRNSARISIGGDADFLELRVANGRIREIAYQCYTG